MKINSVKLPQKADALPMKKAPRMNLIRKKLEKLDKKVGKADRTALQVRATEATAVRDLTEMMKIPAVGVDQNEVPEAVAIPRHMPGVILLRITPEQEDKAIKTNKYEWVE